MAKKKSRRRSRPKLVKYKTTIYQIQVKGPERNGTLNSLYSHFKSRLAAGQPMAKADQYGNVIRALKGHEYRQPNCIELEIVKYNANKTGLAWDTSKHQLVEELNKVSAQKTQLIIYLKYHVAILVHKTHGPTPSQLEYYLRSILQKAADELEIDCSIDILPIKIGGTIKAIKHWRKIKKFKIEVFRPNPDGTRRLRKIKDILDKTEADKVDVTISAKVATGIKMSGIDQYIEEGDRLSSLGQGRVQAEGVARDGSTVELDSKDAKVKYHLVRTTDEETRLLPSLLFDNLKKWFT